MAKIDVTQIEGYENLSTEEKLAKLESYEFNDNKESLDKANKEVDRLKNSITKLSSENADWKRKYNDKLTDEEKAAEEAKAKQTKLEEDLKALQKEKQLSEVKGHYVSLGYSEELALETANAHIDGDLAKVMENQKKFIDMHDKDVVAKAMAKVPTPAKGDGKKGITLDEFHKLSATERAKFAADNPEEYKQLYAK